MSYKLSIAFYVNGMTFNGDSLKTHSLGGSETAGLCMAKELAKRGHYVAMFCNTDKTEMCDGVAYYPIQSFHSYATINDIDVLVAQRQPEIFVQNPLVNYGGTPYKSKLNILWQHDLAIKRNRGNFRGALWNIDEIWGVSDYHINQMSDIYQISKDAFWATRNGIDTIKLDKSIERKNKRLIYTSRPERGLETLLNLTMPKIWEQDPDVELRVAWYDNPVPQMKGFYDSLLAKIEAYKAQGYKVEYLGSLTKKQLYKEYQEATLYAYPTDFEEVSCITAMECMACGLPMITSAKAALPETLKDTTGFNFLIDGEATSEEYQAKFVDVVIDYLNNFEERNEMIAEGLVEFSKSNKWADVAKEWEARFFELFEARTEDKETLARHLYRNEDIMAIKALDIPEWNERIAKEYPLIDDPQAYEDIYLEQGEHFESLCKDREPVLMPYERVKLAIKEFRGCKNILDYGGGIGNEAIQFVNSLDAKVTSANISKNEQNIGRANAEKLCTKPENIDWVEVKDPKEITGTYNGAFCGEILEHIAKPEEFVNEIEKKVKAGGTICFTVPLGSWGDVTAPDSYRGHLWGYNMEDLRDLFGKKRGLKIASIMGGANTENKEVLGWYFVSYRKDSTCQTGTINMERKLAIQAPRQSVSACLIVGGEQEGLMHRCLKSLYPTVDEIIIADTGMSKESRLIAESSKYADKVKIVEAPNPLEYGFDTARNASISHATSDWILWIDCDEELNSANNMFKYLKANPFDGYAIRQHHFSIQPANSTKIDYPIRLFRNNKDIKFFGIVHEHPEKELNEGMGDVTVLGDVDIAHDGYLTEEIRRSRFGRNFALMKRDREAYPNRELGGFLWIRDLIHQARYVLEGTQNQLTPEVIALCEEAIKDYKDKFLGKDTIHGEEGLNYYSEALAILNRGIDFSYSLNAGVGECPAVEPRTIRLENKEEFTDFVTGKMKTLCEPHEGRYV